MRFDLLAMLVLSLGTCMAVGCGQKPAPAPAIAPSAPTVANPSNDEAKFAAAIAKLPEEDRPIATAQKFCAVESDNRLGSMGMPYKLMIEDKPVFLCCEGCKDDALKDAEKTLAKVEELKAASK